jgi:hypothetical protein
MSLYLKSIGMLYSSEISCSGSISSISIRSSSKKPVSYACSVKFSCPQLRCAVRLPLLVVVTDHRVADTVKRTKCQLRTSGVDTHACCILKCYMRYAMLTVAAHFLCSYDYFIYTHSTQYWSHCTYVYASYRSIVSLHFFHSFIKFSTSAHLSVATSLLLFDPCFVLHVQLRVSSKERSEDIEHAA